MNIPSKLKVGGIIYRVEVVKADEFGEKSAALISTEKCLIKILEGDPQFMQQAFWHELVHAINMEIEEEKVEFLAQALMQVTVDNPQLFEKKRKRGDRHGEKRK